jgi:hypothetical protein
MTKTMTPIVGPHVFIQMNAFIWMNDAAQQRPLPAAHPSTRPSLQIEAAQENHSAH